MTLFASHQNVPVVPLWYGGKNQPINPDRLLEVVQSSTGKVVHLAQAAGEAEARAAVEAAEAAFPSWSSSSVQHRRDILCRAADLLAERAEELSAMQTLETSALPQVGGTLPKMCRKILLEIAAQITTACTGSLPPDDGGATIMITKQAIGPVLIMSPWNSPSMLGPRSIGIALAAGCTVVLKASELSPATYRLICQVFEDAGLPDGVLNQIVARREDASAVTEAIISHPAIRKVGFTGSTAIGSVIGQMCCKYLKPILMELGGKGPSVICRDANLEQAAAACASGAFLHHGQICMSTERIIVVKEVAEEFTTLLKEEVKRNWSQSAGNAVTKAFADRVYGLIESAQADGATLLAGDNSYVGDNRAGLKPTIVTGVSQNSQLRYTESFGPTATLYVVNSEDEAVDLANETEYGLVAAIWSRNTMKALSLSKRLEAGIVNVNGLTLVDLPNMSMQGIKSSGWGRNNSFHGINEFLLTKTIVLQRLDEGEEAAFFQA